MAKKQDWSWVTDEMFNDKLEDVVGMLSPVNILVIPGVSDILREHLNNDVLEACAHANHRCPNHGEPLDPDCAVCTGAEDDESPDTSGDGDEDT